MEACIEKTALLSKDADNKVLQPYVEPAFTNVGVLVGLTLFGLGLGGLFTYLTFVCIPSAIISCVLLAVAGILVLHFETSVDEPLPFIHRSLADTGALMVNSYREVMARYVLVLSLPGEVTGSDIVAVYRQFTAEQKHHMAVSNAAPTESTTDSDGVSYGSFASGSSPREKAFDEAIRWLRQPRLQIDIEAQLRLRGLYLQATVGDVDAAVSLSASVSSNMVAAIDRHDRSVAHAQLEDWRALRGMPRSVAKGSLPVALAEADPVFAATHPKLMHVNGCDKATPPASMADVALQLMERRLPGLCVEQTVRRIFLAASAFAVSLGGALLRSALLSQQIRPPRSPRFAGRWELARSWRAAAALVSATSSVYLLALAKGLPPWVCLLILRIRRWLRSAHGKAALTAWPAGGAAGAPAARLQQRLLALLIPGVSRSIFADDP